MTTKSFFHFILLIGLLISATSEAALTSLDLEKEVKTFSAMNAFDVPPKKNIGQFKKLAQIKIHFHRREFAACEKKALEILNKSEVKEWVAVTYLRCALENAEVSKKVTGIRTALTNLKNVSIAEGPWDNHWADVWTAAHLKVLAEEKNPAQKSKWMDSWARHWTFLTREQKADWFEEKASQVSKDPAMAAYFLKQASEVMPQRNHHAKISQLLNLTPNPTAPSVLGSSQIRENEMDQEIETLLKAGDALKAQKLMVKALNEFPQGRFSRKYRDKVLEIYFAQNSENKLKALDNMLDADETRFPDWSQTLHRRLEYAATLKLSKKALSKFKNTPHAASLLWMAGRSAHFLGHYDEAVDYFDELVQKYSSTDEAYEALFRMGLIAFRQGKYTLAASLFERVRGMPRDRYELNAWYWQIRSLEKEKDERAAAERDVLIERYPFSYYGLRLRAEKSNDTISFEPRAITKGKDRPVVLLLPHQAAAWKRFKVLAQNGWILEAQSELTLIPQPVTAHGLWQWVEILSRSQQFRTATILLNRLQEQERDTRHPDFLGGVFPKAYGQWIDVEAKRYNIDPMLIRSLIRQESAFALRAVSTSRAMGLMQMIPPTADEIARRLRMKVQIPDDMFRPEVNIPMGTFYVADMLNQFAFNVPMALGAYNAGPHRLKVWLDMRQEVASLRENHSSEPLHELWFDELPWNETSFYIKAILRNIIIYRLIDKSPVALKPLFWSDLVVQKQAGAASSVVK